MQGIKGKGLIAFTYIIITNIITLREQGKYISIISL